MDKWLKKNIAEREIFYLYVVPEDLNEWRREIRGLSKIIKREGRIDTRKLSYKQARVVNNFSPQKKHRYYCLEDDISVIETEFSRLVEGDESHKLTVNFGSSWNERGKYRVYGEPNIALERMLKDLRGKEKFYANVSYESYRPIYEFQMIYQGSVTKEVMWFCGMQMPWLRNSIKG